MKISEILHYAADKRLCHDYESWGEKSRFSCDAIQGALHETGYYWKKVEIFQGLEEMGCPTGSIEAFQDLGYPDDGPHEETQGARYMWLKFAALMAEEQGV